MTTEKKILIYGSYGYTGSLIARIAKDRGLSPILAGRDQDKIMAQSNELGLIGRVFNLEKDLSESTKALQDIFLVIHCAGPFSHTSKWMVDTCFQTGTHYTDITGEIEVFEALVKRSEEAKRCGVMLLPGVGFDIVPSDCLAAHLKSRLPSATHLALSIKALNSRISRGTAKTIMENIHKGTMIRRNGVLTKVSPLSKVRDKTLNVPIGDVSTAFYSTGIPNIEGYIQVNELARWIVAGLQPFGFFMNLNLVQKGIKKLIDQLSPGPSDAELEKGTSFVFGEAWNSQTGEKVTSKISMPEAYQLTALTALLVAQKMVTGQVLTGFQTPSLAFGKDLILEIPGVSRED